MADSDRDSGHASVVDDGNGWTETRGQPTYNEEMGILLDYDSGVEYL